MKNRYIILTGSKNNAGDFLIKKRSIELLEWIRPDRTVIDVDRWLPLTDKTLSMINQSKALILVGGPALRYEMYPAIYPLVEDLDKIAPPILTMGIGWKDKTGSWADTAKYPLSRKSLTLLSRIQRSNYASSVRDYHSLNVLKNYGFDNYLMTGCPALYNRYFFDKKFNKDQKIKKIGFSLGVSFLHSNQMKGQMLDLLFKLKNAYKEIEICVAFHHSLSDLYMKTHGASQEHLEKHQQISYILEKEGISYVDISGSAQNLIDFYSSCDFHIGYRVHAHIYMISSRKPSILIAEDGRGKGLHGILGGLVFNAYKNSNHSLLSKIKKRVLSYNTQEVNSHLLSDVPFFFDYERQNGYPLTRKAISAKIETYSVMNSFLKQLP